VFACKEIQQEKDKGKTLFPKENELCAMNDNQIYDYCKKLSFEIESYIFTQYNRSLEKMERVSQAYKDKILMIIPHLKDEANDELRIKILCGEISPQQLSKMKEQVYSLFLCQNYFRNFETLKLKKKNREWRNKKSMRESFILIMFLLSLKLIKYFAP